MSWERCLAQLRWPSRRLQQPRRQGGYEQPTTLEKENVNTEGEQHYRDLAEEAQDAAVMTKVKTALAIDGVGNGHPVVVDCDHGVARLSGVVASADDAKHAAQVAAAVPGVRGVDNKLTWR